MTPDLMKYALKISVGIVASILLAWYGYGFFSKSVENFGSIEGTTNYPSEYIPEQTVCAEPVDGGEEICTEVPGGDGEQLTPTWVVRVPPGQYYISARVVDPTALGSDLGDYRAYYTKYVTCGLKYECKDHTKIPITVTKSATVTGISPYDWYIR